MVELSKEIRDKPWMKLRRLGWHERYFDKLTISYSDTGFYYIFLPDVFVRSYQDHIIEETEKFYE